MTNKIFQSELNLLYRRRNRLFYELLKEGFTKKEIQLIFNFNPYDEYGIKIEEVEKCLLEENDKKWKKKY